MKFYRKQPIEAEQFDGSQTSLFGYEVMPDSLLDALTGEPAYYSILIDDFDPEPDDFPDDNEVSFEIGDWIVNEADEIKVMTDEEFKQQHAELPVIPKEIDEHIRWCKGEGGVGNVSDAMDYAHGDVASWIYNERNSDTFARAWLDGYEIDNKSNFKEEIL